MIKKLIINSIALTLFFSCAAQAMEGGWDAGDTTPWYQRPYTPVYTAHISDDALIAKTNIQQHAFQPAQVSLLITDEILQCYGDPVVLRTNQDFLGLLGARHEKTEEASFYSELAQRVVRLSLQHKCGLTSEMRTANQRYVEDLEAAGNGILSKMQDVALQAVLPDEIVRKAGEILMQVKKDEGLDLTTHDTRALQTVLLTYCKDALKLASDESVTDATLAQRAQQVAEKIIEG